MSDVDIIVIGGGPAGHAAALRARELEATVAIVEEAQLGGNCVHHTCIPTTILLDTMDGATRARELGFAGVLDAGEEFYWNRAVARKQQLVAAMAAGIRLQLRNRNVEFVHGRARLLSPSSVQVALVEGGARTLTAGAGVIIATGARPQPTSIPGLAPGAVLWADAALRLPMAPSSVALLVDGGTGAAFVLEFAQLFATAGSRVTVIEPGAKLLPHDEPQLVDVLMEMLRSQGIEILTDAQIEHAHAHDDGYLLTVRAGGIEREVIAQQVVAPDARVPYTGSLELEAFGVRLAGDAVVVDERCATTVSGLYAVGDVTGGPMYSHVAAQQGRVAADTALGERARVDLRYLPRVIATQPELATVGLTAQAATDGGYTVRTGVANLVTNARALTMGQREGVVKVVADSRLGQILGVHALGPGAADMVALAALAMQLQATVDDVAAVTHWHPTIAEALTEAARRAAG